MILLYNLFTRLYVLSIRIAGLWNKKAKEWIRGRKDLFEELEYKISKNDKTIWIHCASAGELEQGKPLIEEIKKLYPEHKIVLSLFSPSGYTSAIKYREAEVVTYLPADTRKNAQRFLDIVHPELVVFVKYEYWFHHLSAIAFHHIPLILVSSIFRKEQLFFKWYGKFYRQMLFLFRHIFVQDESSQDLLKANNIQHSSVAGDTRFDRVKKIADQFSELPIIKSFVGDEKVIIAGSTWPEDERILYDYVKDKGTKIIIAPHEINTSHMGQLEKMFPDSVLYSRCNKDIPANGEDEVSTSNTWNARVLIIDNFGMLSKLYHYAAVTYIGGGFNKSGIHNSIEAAVHGKPVIFGPSFQKFKEARDLIACGGAFSIKSAEELKTKMDQLLNDPVKLTSSGNASKNYVEQNTGATEKIILFIQENRLLTN